MLRNFNYTYWLGTGTPTAMIVFSVGVVFLFLLSTEVFFASVPREEQSIATLAMMISLFATMLGLVLVLISVPLSSDVINLKSNLMYSCEGSVQTHGMYSYYQTLLTI